MKALATYCIMIFVALSLVIIDGCQTPTTTASGLAPTQTPAPSDLLSIKVLATNSSCAKAEFKNRGRAPVGYIKGMALMYAKAYCAKKSFPLGDATHDAVAYYGAANTLRNTYNLLIGLGMRESSGKYCCGRDMSANFSSADSAEAGLFQTSWGARRADSNLVALYNSYKNTTAKCYLDVFKEGVGVCSANNLKNWGEGDGAGWQKLTKDCPAFAVEYAAVVLRKGGGAKGEFGPIRRKEAEMKPECDAMLKQVEDMLTPSMCAAL